MKPEDFDLLLLSEDMLGSLMVLNYIIGNMDIPQYFGTPPELPRENTRGARTRNVTIDEATRKEIYLRSPADIEVYRLATELFNKRRASLD